MTATAGLLLVVQRDIGTASLFVCLYILMLTVTTQRRRFLWIIPLAAVLAGIVGYFVFYVVRERIDILLNPWAQPTGKAYQLIKRDRDRSRRLGWNRPGLGSRSSSPSRFPTLSRLFRETGLLGTAAVVL